MQALLLYLTIIDSVINPFKVLFKFMNNDVVIDTLQQYIADLTQINLSLLNSPYSALKEVKIIQQKIQMKIIMYQKGIKQLSVKVVKGSLITLRNYYADQFNKIVKEAYRILHMKDHLRSITENQGANEEKLRAKLHLIREIEQQMSQQWNKQNQPAQNSITRNLNNITMLSQNVQSSQIKGLAKQYLHKQFLAIRMIAYKMYEQYMSHSHTQLIARLSLAQSEQQSLMRQMNEFRQINKELQGQQKRLVRQLNEIKRLNDMISKRYFIEKEDQHL